MTGRRLGPDERALWARVAATVTPLGKRGVVAQAADPPAPKVKAMPAAPDRPITRSAPAARSAPDTLDGGWDRRLRRGTVVPERTIDLHGHTLAGAHAALEEALAGATRDAVRVLLVVTGKPPRADDRGRGLIRASIGDWLAHSPHRAHIAAIRNAHPRHGGAGALYLILRRKR